MSCPASKDDPDRLQYIRWILNDGVVPLTGIRHCSRFNSKDGLCPLNQFIEAMQEIVGNENWAYACLGNWTNPGVPNQIVDGRPPSA